MQVLSARTGAGQILAVEEASMSERGKSHQMFIIPMLWGPGDCLTKKTGISTSIFHRGNFWAWIGYSGDGRSREPTPGWLDNPEISSKQEAAASPGLTGGQETEGGGGAAGVQGHLWAAGTTEGPSGMSGATREGHPLPGMPQEAGGKKKKKIPSLAGPFCLLPPTCLPRAEDS